MGFIIDFRAYEKMHIDKFSLEKEKFIQPSPGQRRTV